VVRSGGGDELTPPPGIKAVFPHQPGRFLKTYPFPVLAPQDDLIRRPREGAENFDYDAMRKAAGGVPAFPVTA
jgi:hypothetical protein